MGNGVIPKYICLFVILVFAFSMLSIPILAQDEGDNTGGDTGGEEPPPADEPPVEEPPPDDEPPVDEPPIDEPPIDEPPIDEPPVEPPIEPPIIECPPEPDPYHCEGNLNPIHDGRGCLVRYECQTTTCPPKPDPPLCSPDEKIMDDYDDRGCLVGYWCEYAGGEPPPVQCPLIYIEPPECGPDEKLIADHDANGCLVGYFCKFYGDQGTPTCPHWEPDKPRCGENEISVADFDENGCSLGWHCEPMGGAGPETPEPPEPKPEPHGCPVNDVCSDGVTYPCRWEEREGGEGGRCLCDPCPPPQGCMEERDPNTGFVKTVCGTEPGQNCPPINEEDKRRCEEEGGRPDYRMNPVGCEFVTCEFHEGGDFWEGGVECPKDEEMQMHKQKCHNMNLADVVVKDGDCFVVKCKDFGDGGEWQECPKITYEQKESVFQRCQSIGQAVTEAWDEQGCIHLKCGEEGECLRLPPDAFRKCEERGGELMAKDDEHGCVEWHECVMRGDEDSVYYERPDRIPETTELLDIAFKLEALKIEFDKLARKSDDIAAYYESTGSLDAERYRRVADMFQAAKGNVNEIKNKISSRLEHISFDDLMDIRHDIRYLKDVVMKDILYVMLSTSEDVQEMIRGEGDCGMNGECFDRAFRMCKQVKFTPEGGQGPVVMIEGVEGGTCVLKVKAPDGPPGVDMQMTCKIPDYAMGMSGPEQMMPYCVGPMKDYMEQYGIEPGGPGEKLVMCTPEDERAVNECANRGGKMQTDPSTTGECEIAATCVMPGPGTYESPSGGGGFEGPRGPPRPEAGGTSGPCSGCLDNGVCDPGECSDCRDCMGGGF